MPHNTETSLLDEPLQQVEQGLLRSLECQVPTVTELGKHMFSAGGKRIRPRLALLSCALLGYTGKTHIDLACAFELIHTATLIHDDIVDDSSQRRQRLSAHRLWSNSTAVLSGDYLYSRAFELLTASGNADLLRYVSRITNLLAQGELMQLGHINDPQVDEGRYFLVIRLKTAHLFEACTGSAAYLAQTPPQLAKALSGFGLAFGEAFQLRDDYLDYQGDITTIGKHPGGDLRDGKPTLPFIHALTHCTNEPDRQALTEAIRQPDKNGANFTEISSIINSCGGFEHNLEALRTRLDQIDDCLDTIASLTSKTEYLDEAKGLCQLLNLEQA